MKNPKLGNFKYQPKNINFFSSILHAKLTNKIAKIKSGAINLLF